MILTKQNIEDMIEHDYHQLAFSKKTFIDEVYQALKLKELVEKSIMTIGELLRTSNDFGSEVIRPQLILLTELLRQSKK